MFAGILRHYTQTIVQTRFSSHFFLFAYQMNYNASSHGSHEGGLEQVLIALAVLLGELPVINFYNFNFSELLNIRTFFTSSVIISTNSVINVDLSDASNWLKLLIPLDINYSCFSK